jgi:multidrug efflux pump subunit AcrB
VMPDGTAISETEARALEVSRWLASATENPEVASHIAYVGEGGPRFYLTLTPVPPDPASVFFRASGQQQGLPGCGARR